LRIPVHSSPMSFRGTCPRRHHPIFPCFFFSPRLSFVPGPYHCSHRCFLPGDCLFPINSSVITCVCLDETRPDLEVPPSLSFPLPLCFFSRDRKVILGCFFFSRNPPSPPPLCLRIFFFFFPYFHSLPLLVFEREDSSSRVPASCFSFSGWEVIHFQRVNLSYDGLCRHNFSL